MNIYCIKGSAKSRSKEICGIHLPQGSPNLPELTVLLTITPVSHRPYTPALMTALSLGTALTLARLCSDTFNSSSAFVALAMGTASLLVLCSTSPKTPELQPQEPHDVLTCSGLGGAHASDTPWLGELSKCPQGHDLALP